MKANRTSKTGMMHPYLKVSWFDDGSNHWWESDIYPQWVRDRMQTIWQSMVLSERNNSKI
jgi:hypothetical protein